MDIIIPHPFSQARILKTPVVGKVFTPKAFISLLREGVSFLYPAGSSAFNEAIVSVGILERYLKSYRISSITPDERFLMKLKDKLNSGLGPRKGVGLYKPTLRKRVIIALRTTFNGYLFPRGFIKRKVLGEKAYLKYIRVLRLTDKSQNAVFCFESSARRIRSEKVAVGSGDDIRLAQLYTVTQINLTPKVSSAIIRRALNLVESSGKRGFEFITKNDLDRYKSSYEKAGKGKTADKTLSELLCFFVNLKEADFIKRNPFAGFKVQRVKSAVNTEFIPKENINKLRDISSVRSKKGCAVRNRLMCLILYDLAVRLGEAVMLECGDIVREPDRSIRIVLRSSIQKGSNKDQVILYLFFEETKQLLNQYLDRVRPKFSPKCDRLFLTNNGNPISGSHFYHIVKRECKKLHIKTFLGHSPTCHSFRHTFATLNIAPLGLNLPLEEIVDRLRHVGYDTARRHYIHNNPYLRKIKHAQYEKKAEHEKKRSPYDQLDQIPLQTLKDWMGKKLRLSDEWIKEFEKHYSQRDLIDEEEKDVVSYIDEGAALEKVSCLSVSKRLFRKHCMENGKCKREGRKDWEYDNEYISELAKDWVTVSDLRGALHRSKSRFYEDIRNNKWTTMKIGRIILVRKRDLFQ